MAIKADMTTATNLQVDSVTVGAMVIVSGRDRVMATKPIGLMLRRYRWPELRFA